MTLFQVEEGFTPPENLLWNLKMMACPIPMGTIFHVQNFHIFKTNPRLGVISWDWMKKPMLRMRRIRRSLPLLAPFLSLLICLAPQEIHHKTYLLKFNIHKYPKQYLKGEWFRDIFHPNHPSFLVSMSKFRGCKSKFTELCFGAEMQWKTVVEEGKKMEVHWKVVLSWSCCFGYFMAGKHPPPRNALLLRNKSKVRSY